MSNDISDDPWAQRVYLTWLARDTRYALAALNALIGYAQTTPVPPAAWVCFEDFLSFLGKVSRTLWPATGKSPKGTDEGLEWRTKRGPFLRRILEVEDSSPLKAREVRNGSEHFDERLDEWIVSLPRPTVEEWQAGTKPTFQAAQRGYLHGYLRSREVRFEPVRNGVRRRPRFHEKRPLTCNIAGPGPGRQTNRAGLRVLFPRTTRAGGCRPA
ncbi:hypothetical protein ACFVZW_05155, partial [Streptomyces sp. NPDC059567]|uniref:hypothetical protein n=1 Tax=Streptomyces sp. NPDC059567 TaxID=3346867 RepID=UPI0036AE415A